MIKAHSDGSKGDIVTKMVPLSRSIFNKMLFCDQIFQFIELEESLCFTGIDVEFHSFKAGEGQKEVTEQDLLDVNCKHLSSMTVNVKQSDFTSGTGQSSQPESIKEIDDIVNQALVQNQYETRDCY